MSISTNSDNGSFDLSDYSEESSNESSGIISIEKEYFDHPVKVTREDILEQLRDLGYYNVSDEIVEEFMRELQITDSNVHIVRDDDKVTLSSSSKKSKKAEGLEKEGYKMKEAQYYEEKSQIKVQNPVKYIETNESEASDESEDEVTQNVSDEENSDYEGDNERITSADEQIEILHTSPKKEPEEHNSFQTTSSSGSSPMIHAKDVLSGVKEIYSPPKLPAKKKIEKPKGSLPAIAGSSTPPILHKIPSSQETSPREDKRPKTASYTRPASARDINSHASPRRTPSIRQSTNSLPSYYSNKMRLAPVTYRKKIHDPVSRYQQLCKTWEKDKFLSHTKSHHAPLRWQVRKEMGVIAGHNVI
jgi:hypothetical protein